MARVILSEVESARMGAWIQVWQIKTNLSRCNEVKADYSTAQPMMAWRNDV